MKNACPINSKVTNDVCKTPPRKGKQDLSSHAETFLQAGFEETKKLKILKMNENAKKKNLSCLRMKASVLITFNSLKSDMYSVI